MEWSVMVKRRWWWWRGWLGQWSVSTWSVWLTCVLTTLTPPVGGNLRYYRGLRAAGASKGGFKIARVDGDIMIGALFPVHRQPSQKTAFTRQCGEIWEQYGMHRIEVFLKTLDEINANPNILPNITLGSIIRDSCWYPPVALEQSIDFIKNSIASLETNTTKNKGVQCAKPHEKPIAGLIGPGSSTVTIQIQNLLSLFNIPQIGYSATSKDLSDKSLYKFFLRVVPSDKLQAKALVDIVLHYNWTYISTVYTEGNYGFSGMQEFQTMARKARLCEATSDKVSNNADDEAFDRVIENLKRTENARVVICFCEGMTVRRLLEASERKHATGHFLFIGSDGWAVRPDVVQDIEEVAAGGMSIKLYSPPIEEFDTHYLSLNPFTNHRNPWFKEFWQEKFKCRLEGSDADPRFTKRCTGRESLTTDYVQDAKLGFVVNAIYTAAKALDDMQAALCGSRSGLCDAMRPINGSLFMQFLLNVSFTSYSNDRIMFNSNGDPPGRYDIMNFQKIRDPVTGTVHYDYVRVGGWDNGNLTMVDSSIFWPNRDVRFNAPMVDSVCSEPCPKGQVKKIQRGGVHCCWSCSPCKDNEIMLDGSTCKACPQGWWPNADLTACMMIEIEHIQWGDTEAVVAMVFACVGIMTTLFVTSVFVQHNNTAVVKASTRELSYIILFGISVSYITSFPLVAKPSLVTCYLARILPGFSFSLIYGALVTKTNRIARILAGSKKKIMTRKPRFMSACAQVVITCIIIGIECAIITVMLILEPADSKLIYPTKTRVKLTCNATTMGIIVPLGFDIFLIVMCTLYAIKTRNLPENFNEAKFIGFTMYTTCVIWLAFVPIYFGSDNKVITMCLAITLSASVALVLLFFPKIYIIICKPEKNNRSAFTTSKDVRCHIGSTTGRQYSNSNDSVDSLTLLFYYEDCGPETLLVEGTTPRHHTGTLMNKRRVVFPWQTATNTKKKHTSAAEEFAAQWNEKSFENAALSLYRQKSFFNRWKNKSIKGASSHPGGRGAGGARGAASRAAAAPPTSTASSSSYRFKSSYVTDTGRLYPSRENIPMKDGPDGSTKSPRGRRTDESRLHGSGVGPSAGTSWGSMASTSRDDMVEMSPPSSPILHDSSVQTDEELLKYLLPGLRRRRASKKDATSPGGSNKSPSSSEDSHLGGVNGKSMRSNGGGGGGGGGGLRGRLNSASSRGSYHNKEGVTSSFDAASAVHHVTEFEIMDEMDSLLENEHKADTLDATPRRRVGEQSPLLGGEHSPLLTHSTDEKFTSCYSTSEETLSERHAEPFDDLDDLLTGVQPHQGSFGSLTGATIDHQSPTSPPQQQQIIRRQQQLQQQLLQQQQQQLQHHRQRASQIDKDFSSQQLVDIKAAIQKRYPSESSYAGDSASDRLSAFSSRETYLSDTSDEGGVPVPSANQMRPTSSSKVSSASPTTTSGSVPPGEVPVEVPFKRRGSKGSGYRSGSRHGDTRGTSGRGTGKPDQPPPSTTSTTPPSQTLLTPQAAPGYIPHIQVEYATPCPSDSSTPSDLSTDNGGRLAGMADTTSLSRRPSAESSGKASSFTSLEELSLNGSGAPGIPAPGIAVPMPPGAGQVGPGGQRLTRRDNDSVQEFEEYLRRTRGLDLDLSTVQSSDV